MPANALGEAALGRSAATGSTSRGWPGRPAGWASISSPPGQACGHPKSSTTARTAASPAPPRAISTGTRLLDGARLLHLSGITPALGPRSAEAAVAAAEAAARRGVPISFDGNYRAQLWQRWDSDPKAILTRLVAKAGIMFGNHRDISLLLGAKFSGEGPDRRREAAEAAFGAFPNLKMIASTARHVDDADRHRIAARIDTPDGAAQTEEVVVAGIVDRIGAGDAFAAGILHGVRTGPRPRLDGAVGPGADLPQALAARRFQPFRRPRHRGLHGGRAGRPAMISRRLFLAGTGALAAAPAFAQGDPTVPTTLGPVRGTREGGLSVFRGIRYGVAPRFQAPRAPLAGRDVIAATRFGPSSPQRGDRYKPTSEDCLFLNVWTPEARAGGKRPVMVYIHGGAYSTGSRGRSAQRRPPSGGFRRRGGGHRQSPAQRLRLSLSRPPRPAFPGQRQCRPARPDPGASVDPGQYRRIRRRPAPNPRLRPVRRRRQDRDDDGHARRQRPVPPGDHDERPAGHRLRARSTPRPGPRPISPPSRRPRPIS